MYEMFSLSPSSCCSWCDAPLLNGYYHYPYYNNYCNYYGYGGYYRSVGEVGGDANFTETVAADTVSEAAPATPKSMGSQKEATRGTRGGKPLPAQREVTSSRDVSEKRNIFKARQEAASGCAEWLGVTEQLLAAAPSDVAVVDDQCCWHGLVLAPTCM